MRKRILSGLLTFCMVIGMLPTVVFASETNYGDFTVTKIGTAKAPTYAENTLTFSSGGTYTITMRSGVTQTTNDKIEVNSASASTSR